MKRFLKIGILTILIAVTLIFSAAAIFLLVPTNLELKEELLIKSSDFSTFYDTHNNVFGDNGQGATTNLNVNNETLKKAFVAAEDKNFYKHEGLDYLRMIKSAFVNAVNGDFLQGASTISQQLIKNTHLTQEKTLKRKLKEIKLAQKLERSYTKDEILNMYLNSIFFGENRYGVTEAAEYYFSKKVEDLDLSECATLAGMIPSPTKYNPIASLSKATRRRDIVLSRMYDCGYIDECTYEKTANKKLVINVSSSKDVCDCYRASAVEEIYSVTDLTPYQVAQAKIYTYYDGELQNTLADSKTESDEDYQSILIDNDTHGVCAYYSTCGEIKRSPASTIKPLLVYAPAIDTGFIYEATKINDEPINVDGYSPENFNGGYSGYVTAKYALSNSLNIPAVKLYNALGTAKCKAYLKKCGIEDGNDSLNMALGQFNDGVTIKTLAQAYTVFSCGGRFTECRFVRKITDKYGKILYQRNDKEREAFSEGTATIINDVLHDCAKTGTAKKLNRKDFMVCAKTGTLGNEEGNTDAYVVAYTTKHTLACWQGYSDSRYMPNSATGANTPCFCANYVFDNIYKDSKPKDFNKVGVMELYIDKAAYEEKGEFLLPDEDTPVKDTIKCLFTADNHPTAKAKAEPPKIKNVEFSYKNGALEINVFCDDKTYILIEKVAGDRKETVQEGKEKFYLESTNLDATYLITPYRLVGGKKIFGQTIKKELVCKQKGSDYKPDRWWLDQS